MFTRIRDDSCSVYDRDQRNEDIYHWRLAQDPSFRRSTDNFKLIYRDARRGVEQDVITENKLRNLNHVLSNCNAYQAGIQEDRVESSPLYEPVCLLDGLKPQFTKMPRIANHSLTYENPYRAQPGWWYFYTVPEGQQWPGRALFTFDRLPVDTRQNAKDEIMLKTKAMMQSWQNRQPGTNACNERPLY